MPSPLRLLAALLLAAASPAAAQLPDLEPGTRVRVLLRDSLATRYVGSLASLDAHAISLADTGGTTLALPWTEVRRVQRYAGRRGHAAAGAVIGLLAGLVVGAAAADQGSGFAGLVALVGGVGGGALGAAVGAGIRTDAWRDVPHDPPGREPPRPGIPGVSIVLGF